MESWLKQLQKFTIAFLKIAIADDMTRNIIAYLKSEGEIAVKENGEIVWLKNFKTKDIKNIET